MKTPKCPLCGNEMQLRSDEVCSGYYMPLYYYECIGCPLATTPVDTAKEAENQIKDLISTFPFIMRLNVGDNLTYFGTSDFVTVVRKDMESCEIQIETPEGELYIIEPKDVHKWPWELEQEGGQQ